MAQLPVLPLTPEEEVGAFDADELLLQLYAFAKLVVVVAGAKIIARTLAVEMAMAINRITLIIHVMVLGDVYKLSVKLY